jgi:(2R)-phospho-3-sulfolactate synthase (ComA)
VLFFLAGGNLESGHNRFGAHFRQICAWTICSCSNCVELLAALVVLTSKMQAEQAKRCLERGVEQVTVDSLALPGEHAGRWREDIVRRLIDELGLSKLMFEAPDPEVGC